MDSSDQLLEASAAAHIYGTAAFVVLSRLDAVDLLFVAPRPYTLVSACRIPIWMTFSCMILVRLEACVETFMMLAVPYDESSR